jgi:hypothetical protein
MTNNQYPITSASADRPLIGYWLLVIGYSLFDALTARNSALRDPQE